jgi:hypothetical protein
VKLFTEQQISLNSHPRNVIKSPSCYQVLLDNNVIINRSESWRKFKSENRWKFYGCSCQVSFSGVRVTRSLFLWFVDVCLLLCIFFFGHCVFCSSIYGFWFIIQWCIKEHVKWNLKVFTSISPVLMVNTSPPSQDQ